MKTSLSLATMKVSRANNLVRILRRCFSRRADRHRNWKRLQALVARVAPVGYEDETGFHYGPGL